MNRFSGSVVVHVCPDNNFQMKYLWPTYLGCMVHLDPVWVKFESQGYALRHGHRM